MKKSFDLLEKYSQAFLKISKSSIGSNIDWVKKLRTDAFDQFFNDGIPKQDIEEWNTISYKNLSNNYFSILPKKSYKHSFKNIKNKNKDCIARMIFLNGRMETIEIDKNISGISINSLGYFLNCAPELIEDKISNASSFSEHRLSNQIDSRPQSLVALNAAFYQDGAVVIIDEDIDLPGYIEIIYLADAKNISMSPARSILSIGKNSKCEIIEKIMPNAKDSLYFGNHVTDVKLCSSSSLTYLRTILGNEFDINVNTIHASVENDATFYCPTLISTQGQARIESRINLNGVNSFAKIDGLTVGKKKSTSESLTKISHESKNSSSEQVFRTILDDFSQASFRGKIRVGPGAEKTIADMSSKSLMLNDNSQSNSKPELEILADDVKCSHGVTVGSFNPDELFYLCSRGINEVEAKKLLINAFSRAVTDSIPSNLSSSIEHFTY